MKTMTTTTTTIGGGRATRGSRAMERAVLRRRGRVKYHGNPDDDECSGNNDDDDKDDKDDKLTMTTGDGIGMRSHHHHRPIVRSPRNVADDNDETGCGSSGLKGFKCMAFGRAVGEYPEGVKRAEIIPPTECMGSSPPRGIGVNGDPPLPSNLFPEWEEERIKSPPPSPGGFAIALPPSAWGQNHDDFDGKKKEAEEGSKADGERMSPSANVAPPAPAERQRQSSFDIPNSNSSLIDFGEPPSELVCPIGHVCFLSSSGDEEEAHQIDKSPCDSESWLPTCGFISEVCDRDLVVLL